MSNIKRVPHWGGDYTFEPDAANTAVGIESHKLNKQ